MASFASDNYAPVHPAVLDAITAANHGHQPAYGDDPLTATVEELFRVHFGPAAQAFFVFNGTAANVLSLQAVLRPHQAVICASSAHVNTDECGAPERFLGSKLIDVPAPDGRLSVELVADRLVGIRDVHHVQPRALSITQSTELGTRYPLAEVRALADWAHRNGLVLHMDGARLGNAAAALGVGLGDASTGCGVDILSFGGTKNGILGGEAVVFLRPGLSDEFRYIRKQGMQLASKMRYVAAQYVALLADDLWRCNAEQANRMAARLAAGVSGVEGVRITRPVEANAVFAVLPPAAVPPLQESHPFYVWDEQTGEVRWMTAYDTTEQDVDGFVRAIRGAVGQAASPANGGSQPTGAASQRG